MYCTVILYIVVCFGCGHPLRLPAQSCRLLTYQQDSMKNSRRQQDKTQMRTPCSMPHDSAAYALCTRNQSELVAGLHHHTSSSAADCRTLPGPRPQAAGCAGRHEEMQKTTHKKTPRMQKPCTVPTECVELFTILIGLCRGTQVTSPPPHLQ